MAKKGPKTPNQKKKPSASKAKSKKPSAAKTKKTRATKKSDTKSDKKPAKATKKVTTQPPIKTKLYKLTPEHEALLPEYRDRWIRNSMRTGHLTLDEKNSVVTALKGLYQAVDAKEPIILFAPSPFAAAFAAGIAAGVLEMRKYYQVTIAPKEFTNSFAVTINDLVMRIVNQTPIPARPELVLSTVKKESWFHLEGKVDDIKSIAEQFVATQSLDPQKASEALPTPGECAEYLMECVKNAQSMNNGGNTWSGWIAYINFFKEVAKLPLDYSRWNLYEAAAVAGPRYMHEEFCLVSEPPLVLTADDQNLPHNDTGPFCRWSDGSQLYSVHNVRLPGWILEQPETITLEGIRSETNAEIKRIMREKYGESRYLRDIGAKVIDLDSVPTVAGTTEGEIVRALMEDDEGRRFLVGSDGSTDRTYYMEVDAKIATCAEAHQFLSGFSEAKIIAQS